MKKFFINLLSLILILSACEKEPSISDPTFMWGKQEYIVTNEPVSKSDLEKEIGKISNEVKSHLKSDGDAIKLSKSTRLFKIKEQEINKDGIEGVIAVEREGQYTVARKIVKNR